MLLTCMIYIEENSDESENFDESDSYYRDENSDESENFDESDSYYRDEKNLREIKLKKNIFTMIKLKCR